MGTYARTNAASNGGADCRTDTPSYGGANARAHWHADARADAPTNGGAVSRANARADWQPNGRADSDAAWHDMGADTRAHANADARTVGRHAGELAASTGAGVDACQFDIAGTRERSCCDRGRQQWDGQQA